MVFLFLFVSIKGKWGLLCYYFTLFLIPHSSFLIPHSSFLAP